MWAGRTSGRYPTTAKLAGAEAADETVPTRQRATCAANSIGMVRIALKHGRPQGPASAGRGVLAGCQLCPNFVRVRREEKSGQRGRAFLLHSFCGNDEFHATAGLPYATGRGQSASSPQLKNAARRIRPSERDDSFGSQSLKSRSSGRWLSRCQGLAGNSRRSSPATSLQVVQLAHSRPRPRASVAMACEQALAQLQAAAGTRPAFNPVIQTLRENAGPHPQLGAQISRFLPSFSFPMNPQ